MTKEQKAEVIKYLEEELLKTLKMRAISEADHRALKTEMMAIRKPGDKLNAAFTQSGKNIEWLSDKIRNIRNLIAEIKDGRMDF